MESGQQLDWKNLGFGYHPTDYMYVATIAMASGANGKYPPQT